MEIQTRDFGTLTIDEKDIIHFVQPILGFNEYRKFIFLTDQEDEETCFAWLQSVDDKKICFVLTNPAVLQGVYNPKLPASVDKDLGQGEKAMWLLTVITNDIQKATVNLKSPIVLNANTGKGLQVVLDEKLPIRQIITEDVVI